MIGNVDLVGVCDIVKCKCDKNYDVMAHNVKGRTHFCFNQFSAGKCVDPLMRRVGATVFPQHYGPQAGLDSKERLTDAKLRELFGANYKMVRYYDYDTGAYADGSRPQSEVDKSRYAKMKSLFEDDMRMTGVELVVIVFQNISTKDYIKHSGDIPGNIVKSPVSVPFDTRRFGHNAHVGMVLLRNKKTGKILPVPNDWIATGVLTNSMENDPFLTSASFGLPGVARVIDEELWRRDFDTYHKIVDLYFGQNIKQK